MFENAGLNSVLAALALGLPSLTLAVALDKRTDGVGSSNTTIVYVCEAETTSQCDELLSAGLTTQVYFPGTTNYTTREESYWSLDSQLGPTCIVQPRNTAEVAAVMKVLATADGNFAVRSGGHSHWAGGSDIHTGVTIDLGLMTGVTYNPDTSLASIEPGPNWGQVYTTLAAEGAMVVGGRDAGVGVGGFLTGGGNSCT
jgi:FAD/FMN-containing dehydrogenase